MTRNDFFYKFIRTIVYPCFHAIYRIRIQGQENIPPEGPGVLVPKHQFWTDIPIVALTAWRPVNYIAKQELFTYWGVRHFLSLLGAIPLDRGNPVKTLGSFRRLEKVLKEKEFIVVFPEGTYYPNSMGRGKHRFISRILKLQERVAEKDAIPFIPVGIRYQEKTFRTEVEVNVGPAIYSSGEEEAEEFTRRILEEIARLSKITIKSNEC